jgi:hypothetical protein
MSSPEADGFNLPPLNPENADNQAAHLLEGESADPRVESGFWAEIHAAEDLMGSCDYPSYCKFYGDDAGICDRSCDVPMWDQV